MIFNQFVKSSVSAAIAFAMSLAVVSCTEETKGGENYGKADIAGTVVDNYGDAVPGVEVSVEGAEMSAVTGADGSYSLSQVPVSDPTIIYFKKQGYATVAMTIPVSQLVATRTAELNPIVEFASAVITGKVMDGSTGKPLAGASVSIGVASTTTGADGVYKFENLKLNSYTVTFSKTGALSYSKSYVKDDFDANGVINVPDVQIGGREIFKGLTAQHLKDAPIWYSNEYRGGYSRGGGQLDWSTSFMSAQFQCWVGDCEMQNEGCTIRLQNRDQAPDDVNLNSYTYGRKKITAENCKMTVRARCHQAPVQWGVQIVDLSSADPKAVLIGGIQTHPDSDYRDFNFDLSAYNGKEVIVAIGQFNIDKEWHQFCLAHVTFAPSYVSGDGYLTGTTVSGLDGWHMTVENVKSMQANERKHFIGYTLSGLNIQTKSNPAYRQWGGTGHVASEWAFQYVNKDCEPMAGEGFVFKTRSGIDANYKVPESYWYEKVSVKAGMNKMTIRARNFDASKPTVYKVTAIKTDGTVKHLDPTSCTATSNAKASDGCWKFIHERGGTDVPNEYAKFVYDLSSFNGSDIVICYGVFKGDDRDGEQKICLYDITFE
ncbi:MAG: carboxypeptidase regulatory-like domain-containing protein [Bacteroidales bacterium]|nr:carboxypeptidase regulatory-like domain-containing protein [Bacteroidales bacterium]